MMKVEDIIMRDPNRLYGFYSKIMEIHITYFPDLRFFQFTSMFENWCVLNGYGDPFFYEEGKIGELLDKFIEDK